MSNKTIVLSTMWICIGIADVAGKYYRYQTAIKLLGPDQKQKLSISFGGDSPLIWILGISLTWYSLIDIDK